MRIGSFGLGELRCHRRKKYTGYIQNQQREDQMTTKEYVDLFTGSS